VPLCRTALYFLKKNLPLTRENLLVNNPGMHIIFLSPTLIAAKDGNMTGLGLSLSSKLWSIDWDSVLPHQFHGTDFYLDRSSYEELKNFVAKNSSALFTENERDSRFLNNESSALKSKFYEECADIFSYKIDELMVGVFVANVLDWSTYYFRYTNIHPDYRGHQLTERNIASLSQILFKHGVQRICLDVSPSNTEQIQRLSKLGFIISGNIFSERWGSNIMMTKFLDEKYQQVFFDQFCLGLRPKMKQTQLSEF